MGKGRNTRGDAVNLLVEAWHGNEWAIDLLLRRATGLIIVVAIVVTAILTLKAYA